MKKSPIILSVAVFIGGILMVTAQEQKPKIKYRSLYDTKYAYCSIKTNGFVGQENRTAAMGYQGFETSSTAAMIALENGENEISVEFGGINWFTPNVTEKKELFYPDAYCHMQFIKKTDDDVRDVKEKLETISIYINDKGEPAVKESDVVMAKRIDKGAEQGYLLEKEFDPNLFPAGMALYEFKKKVVVEGLPEWAWTKAEEYKDTPEQRAKLEQAYMALWQDFNNKDIGAIKQKMKVALQAWSYTTGSTQEEFFNDMTTFELLKRTDFRLLPLNWNNYTVSIMNKGRMIRLVNKSDFRFSPISFEYGEDEIGSYAPTFSLIDGEFVIVL